MDSRWYKFAEICQESFSECDFQTQLLSECGGLEDIAWATFYHLGDDALSWLHRKVPSLNNELPFTLIQSGRSDEVREALWGFPC